MSRSILAAFALLLLGGSCRSLVAARPWRQAHKVWVAKDLALPLFDVAMLEDHIDLQQELEGEYGGERYFLTAFFKADESGLSLTGLNAMGAELLGFAYAKDGTIRASGAIGGNIKAEYLVFDLQLAYYPSGALSAALAKTGLSFEESGSGESRTRSLIWKGRRILHIDYMPDGFVFTNELRSYRYRVKETAAR